MWSPWVSRQCPFETTKMTSDKEGVQDETGKNNSSQIMPNLVLINTLILYSVSNVTDSLEGFRPGMKWLKWKY